MRSSVICVVLVLTASCGQISQGERGPQGERGEQGLQGPQGADGATGQRGSAGQDGRNGTDGQDGTDGAQGVQGDQGSAGADGKDGAAGISVKSQKACTLSNSSTQYSLVVTLFSDGSVFLTCSINQQQSYFVMVPSSGSAARKARCAIGNPNTPSSQYAFRDLGLSGADVTIPGAPVGTAMTCATESF